MGGHSPADRGHRWQTTIGACLALLALPAVGWFVLAPPAPKGRVKATAPVRQDVEQDVEAEGAEAPPAPARAARVERRPAAAPGSNDEGRIEGEVVDPDGKPVAEASVRCVLGERELETKTDAEGAFHFPADAVGCTAEAKKRGFATSGATTFAAGVRLRLARAAGISGVVVEEDGAPVPTYLVGVDSFEPAGGEAPDAGSARLPSMTVNDAEGAFTLEDLAPGRYVLGVGAAQHVIGRTAPIDVRAGTVTKGVRIVLARGRTVSGTVIDARTRKPLAGALVFAETPPTSAVRSVPSLTSPAGEFTLEGACPAKCTLHASLPGRGLATLADVDVPERGDLRVELVLGQPGDAQ